MNEDSQDPFEASQLAHSRTNLDTIFEDAQDLVGPSSLDTAPSQHHPPLLPFTSTHRYKDLRSPDLSIQGIGAMDNMQDVLEKLTKAVESLDGRIKKIETPRPPPPPNDDEEDPTDKFLDFDPAEIIKLTLDHINNPNIKSKSKTRDREELEVLKATFKNHTCIADHFEEEDRRVLLRRVRFLYTALTGNWTRAAVDRRDLDLATAGITYSDQAAKAKPYRRRGTFSSRGRGRGTRTGAVSK